MTMTRPDVLIEDWFPIEEVGVESKRERGASSALPPLYFLHVWWARRPLIASRAAILASVLPKWSEDFPEDLKRIFPNEKTYHKWFLELCGIFGDPVQARKILDWAKQQGKSIPNPYTHDRAFKINPSVDYLKTMGDLLEYTWGTRDISVLDPFAGGGSIPFESLRYGFTTIANELNPVASTILKATLDYPARFGATLTEDIKKWGKRWYELVKPKLKPYFTPLPPNAEGAAYLWARSVACPTTGKPVPLSPNWWLSKGDKSVAVELIAEEWMDEPQFRILSGDQLRGIDPDDGTVSRGVGRSPWTGETISGDYIKAEAQAGRMGEILYAVASKVPGGFEFRAPTEVDHEAVEKAKKDLLEKKTNWIARDIIPTEKFPEGNDNRPIIYGMPMWSDFFSPRQLLSLGTFLNELIELEKKIIFQEGEDKGKAIILYLDFVIDKCVDYNSRQCTWHPSRSVISHTFSKHDYSFKWSNSEFDSSANLLPWAIDQIYDAYKELAAIAAPAQVSYENIFASSGIDRFQIIKGSAMDIGSISDHSIQNITMDPPYYDNVQYAELSDFFYVWLKRSVGHIFPEFFKDELTNKDDEAVANPARFEKMGKKKKLLAEQDYERKMTAVFKEMYRVLEDKGTLTVMFTHKKVEAWDTLASSLINAGFSIKSSWPIHTESEHSLHQAKKNAAASTILLTCRKRIYENQEPIWWDDIQQQVRETARQKAAEFVQQGITGVDLYLSTFGPTLSIISEHWPVLTSEVDTKTGEPKPIRPEVALELAREEVVRLRKQGLLLGRDVQFDPLTDWYLMAWDAFAAEQFPYDEARKLAIAMGVDLDQNIMRTKRLAAKKGEYVILQPPQQRRKKGMVDEEAQHFEHTIDAVHTAMMVYEEDGGGACDLFLMNSGLKQNGTFKACLQAMINAIPRSRIKGKFVRKEAETLENLRLAFFDDLEVPVEEDVEIEMSEQLKLGL
jgi:putative DNA methylase